LGEYSDVEVCDEGVDVGAAVFSFYADVVEFPVVTQG